MTLPLSAQTTNPRNLSFGGTVFNHDLMMAGDFASLARPQVFGTARVMGMGGAFVSLGADLTSMSLNPAGLGMYRRNEFSLTPMVTLSRAENPGAAAWSGNSKNRFSFANVGIAFNVFESSTSALTSMTIGFGLNRIADFNARNSFSAEDFFDADANRTAYSIADVFRDQLQKGANTPGGWAPIMPRPDGSNPNGPLDYENPYFWPATLGYKGTMIYVDPATGEWARDAIGHNATVRRSFESTTTGSINEFDLSFGGNINNIVYFGATLGIQSVHKRTDMTYGEDYGYFNRQDGLATDASGQVLPVQLDYADLWQRVVLDGSGVNFKLGVVVRPIAGLRLGAAFHTPTFYSLDRSYRAGLESLLLYNDGTDDEETYRHESPTQYDENDNSWEFVSPSRLMFGASYTFGSFAIVSVDYERDWYNGIRVKNVPYGADFGKEDYKMDFKNNFCATNAVRAGVEIKPLPILSLRAGGGYTSSMLQDASLAYEMPLSTESYYFSVGAGVNFTRNVSLDLAYQNLTDKQSRYMLFYTYDNAAQDFVNTTGLFDTEYTRHYISMTLSFRF